MENITFYDQINIFLENKMPRKLSACVYRPGPTHVARVSKTYERQVFCINVEERIPHHLGAAVLNPYFLTI